MTVYAYTDGASRGNPGESGIGVILRNEQGEVLFSGSGYIGTATNNVAEYEALLACLRKALETRCTRLVVYTDSQLLARQMQGKYKVRDKKLIRYVTQAREILTSAPFELEIVHVEREQNRDADFLANSGIDNKQPLRM